MRSLTPALQTWVQKSASRTGSVEKRQTWLKLVISASQEPKYRFPLPLLDEIVGLHDCIQASWRFSR